MLEDGIFRAKEGNGERGMGPLTTGASCPADAFCWQPRRPCSCGRLPWLGIDSFGAPDIAGTRLCMHESSRFGRALGSVGLGGKVPRPPALSLFYRRRFPSRALRILPWRARARCRDSGSRSQQLVLPAEVEKHAHLPRASVLRHLERRGCCQQNGCA